jgi:hypothetical protein
MEHCSWQLNYCLIGGEKCKRMTAQYCFGNRDVPIEGVHCTLCVSLAVITGTGIGIVEIIGLPHQNTTTCETLGGYYVAQSIGRNRAL